MIEQDPTATIPPQNDADDPVANSTSADTTVTTKTILSEHKGKLAIGAAATLGLMIFYNWRQKKLAQEDPEAYATLQRVRESLKKVDNLEAEEAALPVASQSIGQESPGTVS